MLGRRDVPPLPLSLAPSSLRRLEVREGRRLPGGRRATGMPRLWARASGGRAGIMPRTASLQHAGGQMGSLLGPLHLVHTTCQRHPQQPTLPCFNPLEPRLHRPEQHVPLLARPRRRKRHAALRAAQRGGGSGLCAPGDGG